MNQPENQRPADFDDRPISFSLANKDDVRDLRSCLRVAVDEAIENAGLSRSVLAHVGKIRCAPNAAFLEVRLCARDSVTAAPFTPERAAFMARALEIQSEHGIGEKHLGMGIVSPGGSIMGWLVGLDTEDGSLAVVEEAGRFRDWVGIPLEEVAYRLKRFKPWPADARPGGRIA